MLKRIIAGAAAVGVGAQQVMANENEPGKAALLDFPSITMTVVVSGAATWGYQVTNAVTEEVHTVDEPEPPRATGKSS